MATTTRRALVFAPIVDTFADLCESVRQQPWTEGIPGESSCTWRGHGLELQLDVVQRVDHVRDRLSRDYYNLIVVDCRNLSGERADASRQVRALNRLLDALRAEPDQERRYPKRRIAVLVGDADNERVDELIFRMGQRHVGACIRDQSLSPLPAGGDHDAAKARFVGSLWTFCRNVLVRARHGKRAIALAGGGITGIYYELGVLKCLHDAIDLDIRDFDLYFGISGGAVITSCLANGMSIDDVLLKIGSLDPGWDYDLKLGLRHLNVSEVPNRLLLAQRELFKSLTRIMRREEDVSFGSLFGVYAVVLGPLFQNAEFERVLHELFNQPGRSDDFRDLGGRLFVGATDQDRREHVLFGDPGLDDVAISRAVRASCAMHPFFPSVEINGHWYTDGIATKTSNFKAAIERGADLVFVIDPFVPLISDRPGYNARHGNMWILQQDTKTMAFTRFEQARDEVMRSNPDVNLYTFLPSNRMRYMMSDQNPFLARNFHPIVCAAYRSTARRLRQLEYKIAGELASHDIQLDLAPVDRKVELLRSLDKPTVHALTDDEPEGAIDVA